MTFEKALYIMPVCLVGALDNPQTVEDLLTGAQFELDLYEENQDGCISDNDALAVRAFIKRLKY